MGSGKTTLGKRLSNKLNVQFFDLDAEIEKTENLSVNEIFEKHGETYFRDIEVKVLEAIIENNESFVMSLGGGTPCYYNNMELINQSGVSIYIKYNSGILTSRLLNAKKQRPLIKDFNDQELKTFIANKLNERELFYAQSKFVVEKNNVRVEDILFLL